MKPVRSISISEHVEAVLSITENPDGTANLEFDLHCEFEDGDFFENVCLPFDSFELAFHKMGNISHLQATFVAKQILAGNKHFWFG